MFYFVSNIETCACRAHDRTRFLSLSAIPAYQSNGLIVWLF
jgi:hypothetical protein